MKIPRAETPPAVTSCSYHHKHTDRRRPGIRTTIASRLTSPSCRSWCARFNSLSAALAEGRLVIFRSMNELEGRHLG